MKKIVYGLVFSGLVSLASACSTVPAKFADGVSTLASDTVATNITLHGTAGIDSHTLALSDADAALAIELSKWAQNHKGN